MAWWHVIVHFYSFTLDISPILSVYIGLTMMMSNMDIETPLLISVEFSEVLEIEIEISTI